MDKVGVLASWCVVVVGVVAGLVVSELMDVRAPLVVEAYAVSPVVRGSGGRVVVVCADGGLLRGVGR